MVFDNKLRLPGAQFAVNFHFLQPSSQGSTGPGKGDMHLFSTAKEVLASVVTCDTNPHLAQPPAPPRHFRYTRTCTRPGRQHLYTACSHTADKRGSRYNTAWLAAGMGDISSSALMSCPNHCARGEWGSRCPCGGWDPGPATGDSQGPGTSMLWYLHWPAHRSRRTGCVDHGPPYALFPWALLLNLQGGCSPGNLLP